MRMLILRNLNLSLPPAFFPGLTCADMTCRMSKHFHCTSKEVSEESSREEEDHIRLSEDSPAHLSGTDEERSAISVRDMYSIC